jgi:hypothetical protein
MEAKYKKNKLAIHMGVNLACGKPKKSTAIFCCYSGCLLHTKVGKTS